MGDGRGEEEDKRWIDVSLIRINDRVTGPDCRVGSNDVISHVIHRY